MFCRSLFVRFLWPLCCLFLFDIRFLITPLVSSNSNLVMHNSLCFHSFLLKKKFSFRTNIQCTCFKNNNYRLIHGLFILPLLSARDIDIGPFTRGQITCYCPRKMLLPREQVTRRKLCFYYTCKFGVISIKYVIIYFVWWLFYLFGYCYFKKKWTVITSKPEHTG